MCVTRREPSKATTNAPSNCGDAPNIRDIADGFCGSYKIYTLDGAYLPHAECPMAQVVRTGKAVSNEEIVIERPDGSRRTAIVNILPRRTSAETRQARSIA
jgi:hypothetical protein